MKYLLVFSLLSISLLSACASAAPTVPTATAVAPVASTSPAEMTAVPVFDIQKLEGIWIAEDNVYVRQSADGKYTVIVDANSIKTLLGRPLEGSISLEGDLLKLHSGGACLATDVGIYRIALSEDGGIYTLDLVEDPCEYRKDGDVPAANTYRKLEALVLPGAYTTEITQAQAEAAGGGDLLNYVGEWEIQFSAENTYALLQNGQTVAQGEYLSADEQFTLEHADICSGMYGPVLRAALDAKSVTFSQDPDWTAGYKCKDMLLILTGHPWTKE